MRTTYDTLKLIATTNQHTQQIHTFFRVHICVLESPAFCAGKEHTSVEKFMGDVECTDATHKEIPSLFAMSAALVVLPTQPVHDPQQKATLECHIDNHTLCTFRQQQKWCLTFADTIPIWKDIVFRVCRSQGAA